MKKIVDLLVDQNKQCIIEHCSRNDYLFLELLNLALDTNDSISWRASSVLSDIMLENDARLISYINRILQLIPQVNHSHQRELLKIVYKIDVSEDLEGHIFDLALSIWRDINKQSSVRYYAFKCILKIADKHPELKNEIHLWSAPYYLDSLSKGIRHSIMKMLDT